MGAPRHPRFAVDFDEWFPEGLYLVGEIQAVTEYQSAEDRARNRPARSRVDEVSGLPLFRGTFADPSAEKDREKSVTVEFACAHQPVPPPAVAGVPFRPVVLEGMTVAPRAEASGQAKWITGNPCGGDVRAGGRHPDEYPRACWEAGDTGFCREGGCSVSPAADDSHVSADPPQTLVEAYHAVADCRPARPAPLPEWLAYHQRCTAWYAEVAEVDRGHHHEALARAEQQRQLANKIKAQMSAQRPVGEENGG